MMKLALRVAFGQYIEQQDSVLPADHASLHPALENVHQFSPGGRGREWSLTSGGSIGMRGDSPELETYLL